MSVAIGRHEGGTRWYEGSGVRGGEGCGGVEGVAGGSEGGAEVSRLLVAI